VRDDRGVTANESTCCRLGRSGPEKGKTRVHFDLQLAECMQAKGVSLASIARAVGVSPRIVQRALLKPRQNSAKTSLAVSQAYRELHDSARFLCR